MSKAKDGPHAYRPKVGDEVEVSYLPRDIRLGARKVVGELLTGWCLTTNTRQLWEVVSEFPSARARFLGYVVSAIE